MRVSRHVSVALVALIGLAGCASERPATPSHRPATSASPSSRTAPPGVPAPVYRAALDALDYPGNRITAPVQWVETTFGAYERVATPGSSGTAATERAPVYVVQVEGSFAFTGSWTGGGSHAPGPYSVNGMIMPIGDAVPGTTEGYQSNTPIDLGKIAVVHTFVMP